MYKYRIWIGVNTDSHSCAYSPIYMYIHDNI